ncbi:putative hydrolase of the HAD superfamily [Kribbella antiqua]|uniref:Putative hydrolase of the HAD superfamily n=1 Tax=Kribbella antiqua TaxID=2512217 RepID=A0A4R2IHA7_9ACTN|nr:HAD-IA family hydrolase [Kribbella antiqua]TCO44321.1 putative hydrolase of the HAD superfamily [Kribbella antiqua]
MISAVLFDADGVIQRPTLDWWSRLTSFVPADGDAFVAELMSAEKPALVGKGDFREAVAEVLRRWDSTVSLEDALEPWHWFAAEPAVVELIAGLRAAGVGCHLATNQHAYRRAIMQDERGYGAWFDQTFYSCDLGLAKPDPAYFRAILGAIDVPASSVLFIDDNAANVDGALSVGLQAEVYDLESGVDELVALLRRYGLPA